MKLYFITGNSGKVTESKQMMPDIEQLDIELPEIQDLDPHKIIKVKLKAAFDHHDGPFMVEDTSFYLDCLKDLPGPFIKWFLQSIGAEGIYDIASAMGNADATVSVIIGYAKNRQEVKFFEGKGKGKVVKPRGDRGFGWDFIFQPDGFQQTFAEMSLEQKNQISMRRKAFAQLTEYLNKS